LKKRKKRKKNRTHQLLLEPARARARATIRALYRDNGEKEERKKRKKN
jgi:hypothetical protein